MKKTLNKIKKLDSNFKELLSGSFISFILKISGMILSYLVIFYISKKLGAEGAGIYSLSFNILNSMAIIGTLGANTSILRFSGEFNLVNQEALKGVYKYSFIIAMIFSSFLGVFLYFSSDYLANFILNNEKYTEILKIIAVSIPFFSINLINVEFIRGIKKLKISEFFRGPNNYIIILILMVLVFEVSYLNVIISLFIAVIITFVLTFTYVINYLRKIKKVFNKSVFRIKKLITISLPMMLINVSSLLLGVSGAFILEVYSSSEDVGVFNVCIKIAQLVSIVLLVINTIAAPKFSELFWQSRKEELQKMLNQSSRLIFIGSLLVSIPMIFLSSYILSFFGEEFISGTSILFILILGQLVNSATGSVGIFMNMTGQEKVLKNILLFNVTLIILGFFLIIPKYGSLGAAVVTFLGTCLVNIPAAIYVEKKLKYVTYFNPFKK